MNAYHVIVHALPRGSSPPLPSRSLGPFEGRSLPTFSLAPEQLRHPFPLSFEEAGDRLSGFDRLYFEPDGSFVWVGMAAETGTPWQLDGVLFDHQGRLIHVELKGTAPPSVLALLLRAIEGETVELVLQSVRQALFATADDWLVASPP